MNSIRFAAVLLSLTALTSPPVFAGTNWTLVHAGSDVVEIDRDSIRLDSGGSRAWSRVRLEREARDVAGSYDSIRAENLYDCAQRRFTTLRRAYFLAEGLVREEDVARRRANQVKPGSLDERLLNLACKPGSNLAGQGDKAGKPASDVHRDDATAAPKPMHADLRRGTDGDAARVFVVADAATDKPKLIQLPAIDKSALAQAAAAQEAAARANQEAGGKTAPVKPPAPVMTKVPPAGKAEAHAPEPLSEKRIRELHYANSGPPRISRKKAPTAPSAEAENPAQHMHQHWSYEGETGPANWAKLRPDYAACASGKRQSPIDIRDGIRVNLEAIRFDYKPMQFRIVDNGHTVQVNLGEGSSLSVMGKRYALQQFHFHRPSEERISGRSYDMSVHLVHRNDEGQLAVLAVLLEKGTEHSLIQTLLNNLPLEQDTEMAPEEVIDPGKLLPENRAYWTYMGSLTTPPCTEGVLWMVMKQALQVGSEQVSIFSRVFRNNSRPTQAHNGRMIKETR